MKKLTVFVLVAGCSLGSKRDPISHEQPKEPERLTPEHVRSASRIVVDYGGGSCGGGRWSCSSDHYVLSATGKCSCERSNCDGSKKSYELPPETFDEVQKILVESKYLSLQDLPGFDFESSSWLSVESGGRKHSLVVHAYPLGDYPPDFQRMRDFLGSLENRRKEIPSSSESEK